MNSLVINFSAMNIPLSSLFCLSILGNFIVIHMVFVSGQCQSNQQSLLLQIKNSLIFNSTLSVNLVHWSRNTDCCHWSGVDCNGAGLVVGLNLSNESISGGIENATGLFCLKYLQRLNLAFNWFNGTQIPSRLTNLTNLSYLNLSNAGFAGQFPGTFSGMKRFVTLDFSSNHFHGPVPSFHMSRNRSYLNTSHNVLNGSISSISWERLLNPVYVDFTNNSLNGRIPPSLFALPSLQKLQLANNQFEGQVPEFSNASTSVLDTLDLSCNRLEGSIPTSVFKLKKLQRLLLSSNKFNGTVQQGTFQGLGDLSHNLVAGMEEPYSISGLLVLDLHSNQLQGRIPYLPPTIVYVDYSTNNFSSSIPADIGNSLSSTTFFSLSNNSLTGVIPGSICNATKLQVLNLSNNNLSGVIPTCLFERSENLGVLNLRRNRLDGTISGTFPKNCGLQTLDLSGNKLEGILPKSLINCSNLEVLDLGNNRISDKFPCWSKKISRLRVVVLRSNKFYGNIGCLENNTSWPLLQIVDLASNNFSGGLPKKFVTNLEAMMLDEKSTPNVAQVRYIFRGFNHLYYQDEVTIASKGQKMELKKIQAYFTSVDLSCNNFQGPIPEEIGRLRSLHVVNLSHNAFTGTISSSIRELRQLESVDLSVNNLSGEIPAEVVSLSFLSFVNVSYNHLVGRIPLTTQLQSFSASCFEGNEGLCGAPLMKQCTNSSVLPYNSVPSALPLSSDIDCDPFITAVGFATGFGAVVVPLMTSEKINKWYVDLINKFLQ